MPSVVGSPSDGRGAASASPAPVNVNTAFLTPPLYLEESGRIVF